jgi:NADH:ubiquinone oxidoreductase subunit K
MNNNYSYVMQVKVIVGLQTTTFLKRSAFIYLFICIDLLMASLNIAIKSLD